MRRALLSQAAHNKRLERTRHERASLVSCVGEPLKRGVISLPCVMNHELRVARVGGGKPPFPTAFFRLESFQ